MRKSRWKEKYQQQQINLYSKEKQLTWLEEYVTSPAHFDYTPTTYYGDHDPFDALISACAKCQRSTLKLWSPLERRPSWRVVCACGNRGPASRFPRKAVFRWNKSVNSQSVDYQNSPLFQLQGWGRKEATERLFHIQNDLSLRIEIANLRQELLCDVRPGYISKLMAYVDWTQYLLDLIKKQHR